MAINAYFHLPAIAAGFVAVLVGFTGSAVIIFHAAQAAGASTDQIGSWMMVLGFGMAATTIGLSLRYKTPIITAWSTPGAALLVTALPGIPMAEAVGAFLFSAALITLCGITGWFEKAMDRIPLPIAAAMLAGVLFQFGVAAFTSMQTAPVLAAAMFAAYLLSKKTVPRYSIIVVLFVGVIICGHQGLLDFSAFSFVVGSPDWITPVFSFSTLIGVGIPLFVVTMVSQNTPGVAVLRASGYQTPTSPLITWTGLATLVLAPMGGFAINLAAITAAICTGPEVHENPENRYIAALSAGFFYTLLGVFGFAAASLFAAFPAEFTFALAGLALLSTIAGSLTTAVVEESTREAAVITFLVTASGLTLFGIGSSFWGLLCGVIALFVFRK